MNYLNLVSNSSNNTMQIARILAQHLEKGNVVILTGELGSGKTKFTEGFLSYFHLEDEISSPTFNIVNEYTSQNVPIYHFDVYRLADVDEFYTIGGEEYFDKGICLIEWGELIEDALPKEYLQICFEKDPTNENSRNLIFKAIGKQYEILLDSLSSNFLTSPNVNN